MGDDTLYSGTVAAATEGYLLGIPSIAMSLVGREFKHYASAARVARELVERLVRAPMGAPVLLNVNVPDVPYEAIAGIEVTRLGRRHKAQPVVAAKNPRGETVYWVGPAGAAREAGPGTDFNALERGAVSVTPLQVDLTHAGQIALVADWIAKR
jgi:5'-nucleotidase